MLWWWVVQVVHARLKGAAPRDFAIKIMDKSFIKKENKVGGGAGWVRECAYAT